ncbi:MAG: hypothetical protein JNL83_35345 [Myxococcales bacterium]|nr:hypothetical protein [Myxococcales bacterium]
MYGGARLKVWQVVVLGALWMALGVVLHLAIEWDSSRTVDHGYYKVTYTRRGVYQIFVALKLWLTGPVLIGLWHWFRAWEASRVEHAAGESAMNLPIHRPVPPPLPSGPLPPAPRLGDDPFRDPPAPAPIVVQRPTAPSAAPMAATSGDPGDKPKLLV